MILGRIIGQVWGSQRSAQLGPEKMLLVSVLGAPGADWIRAPTGRVVVALDTLGARSGELVTVTWGSGARAVLKGPSNRSVLVDAAIARIVDGTSAGEE
ncbi:MAG: EutN/CcmL family microcompartment protein [Pseudomonadota bacterium]